MAAETHRPGMGLTGRTIGIPTAQERARRITCPACGAKPHQRCHRVSSSDHEIELARPHRDRVRLARLAR